MTQEELIKCGCWLTDTGALVTDDIDLQAFAKLVAEQERAEFAVHAVDIARRSVAEEREACAKIADEWAVGWPHPSTVIAERIRARGQA